MLRIRTIRASILQRHKGTLLAVSVLALSFAGILISGDPRDPPNEASHVLAHLSRGVPLLLLALAVYRLWRPRNPILRVARVLFVMFTLVIGAGQLEHSIGAFAGDPPHIVGKTTASQLVVIGLAILLAIANMLKAWRSR